MTKIRMQLLDNVFLTYVPADKFKTDFLSAQFIAPLRAETAGLNALLPAVLQRGTEQYPDMQRLSAALDLLYGATIEHSVRKRGENQLWGFLATCVDDAFVRTAPGCWSPWRTCWAAVCRPRWRGGPLPGLCGLGAHQPDRRHPRRHQRKAHLRLPPPAGGDVRRRGLWPEPHRGRGLCFRHHGGGPHRPLPRRHRPEPPGALLLRPGGGGAGGGRLPRRLSACPGPGAAGRAAAHPPGRRSR